MKRIILFFMKIGAVCFTLLSILFLLSPVFTPKFFGLWPTTATVNGFYALEDDSIDVLFLGSSQIMTAVSPMQIYEETGITSYNLGTEQQSMLSTYYLLKEALKTQKPKVVVLEIHFLFTYNHETPVNSDEQFVRKTFDYMKWSSNKWEAVRTLCALDDDHSLKSYLLPFLRYHDRWSDLSKEDFTYTFQDKSNPFKGFSLTTEFDNSYTFSGYLPEDIPSTIELPETMLTYFNKIVSLCKENGISLVLMKTPRGDGSFQAERHNTIQPIADENNLVFIDFNEKALFDEIGYNTATDYLDSTHVNYFGAKKITHYLASYLSSEYSLEDKRNKTGYETWNKDLETYLSTQ